MIEIKDILKNYAYLNHWSMRQFAEKCGIDPSQMNKYFKGHVSPSEKVLKKIKEIFPDFNYLPSDVAEPGHTYGPSAPLPLFEPIPIADEGDYLSQLKSEEFVSIQRFKDCNAHIRVKGDEIEPLFRNGDYATVKKVFFEQVNYGALYFIVYKNQNIRPAFRIISRTDNTESWKLKAHNKKYDDFEVSIDAISEIFLVRGGVIEL